MGKRSGVLDHESDILKLSLEELDAEIARCEMRLKIAPTSYLRKSFEKRIHWLGRIRTRHPTVNSN
ncbi:hypothetical protein [Sphingomonas sp.]|uniref:hypothetical protein n=1 Tax=Sphingomonas sp. TaxID=28214 RepID=UPI00181112EA|nr:hypothetical protein [Sphingomonas sp.]MBA3510678.1 hypothetical protein [Sphingomonas sp.]